MSDVTINDIAAELREVKQLVSQLIERQPRGGYTSTEFGRVVGISAETIADYCRLRRLIANKDSSGEWRIPHHELERYQAEGLLTKRTNRRRLIGRK